MEIPTWWLALSALFFVASIVVLIALLAIMMRALKTMQELQPTLKKTAERMESAAAKVESLAGTAKQTVEHVGERAGNVADGVSMAIVGSTQRFAQASQILTAAFTVIKLIGMVKQARGKGKVDRHEDDEE